MKSTIVDISEISDSRELLESKPLPFIQTFIYIIVTIILVALIWSYFGEIDLVVKANGIVRPSQGINTITSKATGKATYVNLENGKKVEKGELLLSLNSDELNLEIQSRKRELDKKKLDLLNLNKLKESIIAENNLFSKDIKEESDYYYRYLKYHKELEGSRSKVDSIKQKIRDINKELLGIQGFLHSMESGKNLIDEDNIKYSLMFDKYLNTYKNHSNKVKSSNEELENNKVLFEAGIISKMEYDKIKSNNETIVLEFEEYVTSCELDMRTNLDSNKKSLEEYKYELKQINKDAEFTDDIENILEDIKTDYLININNEIEVVNDRISSINDSIESLNLKINNCNIYAQVTGYTNLINQISNGDLIMNGKEVATIVPEDGSGYKIQIYISNKDISNIHIGDKIKYHFLALPHREYGELEGEIESISTDATLSDNNTAGYYMVEASITDKPLYSYKGDKSQIKVGMLCESHIITRRKKILFYLLEKIDLWD
ncbi:HlyD family efflux transporter periplasmic adaptor subunit [Crassaminicella profunda]|uniref:HlyD family efflux transporter periplasmic adaptor subunit n=1 Tax=Crassaminicella profunda TaxID=1286698 RepID=UPI001CA618E1|nr:HlyD family efflux transporter periplasmic adaptor subunit [Crassaminicella profunda]QZY54910.1 HlyD family efflux transporter periplasmic adaptor subunit [Crassaminicella profunda]